VTSGAGADPARGSASRVSVEVDAEADADAAAGSAVLMVLLGGDRRRDRSLPWLPPPWKRIGGIGVDYLPSRAEADCPAWTSWGGASW
jgi:hypothetical protein